MTVTQFKALRPVLVSMGTLDLLSADIIPEHARDVKMEAREFVDDHIQPKAEEYHRSGEFPYEVLEAAYDAGIVAQNVPEEYGGRGSTLAERLAIIEELFRADAGMGLTIQVASFTANIVAKHGTEEQCERFVEPVTAGEAIFGLASTEPEGGSDLAGMETAAERDGGEYVLDGEKWWVTNGVKADWLTVYVRTGEERGHDNFSLVVVPTDTDGVEVEAMPEKSGMRASEQGILTLEGTRVPVENRIGEEGEGFSLLVEFFNDERVVAGGHGTGLAAAALEEAWEFVHEREAYGGTIGDLQAVQHDLAEMKLAFEQARSVVWRACEKVANEENVPLWASTAKIAGTEMADDLAETAAELHGGRAVLQDERINRVYRDIRAPVAYEGANDAQKDLIYQHMGPNE